MPSYSIYHTRAPVLSIIPLASSLPFSQSSSHESTEIAHQFLFNEVVRRFDTLQSPSVTHVAYFSAH